MQHPTLIENKNKTTKENINTINVLPKLLYTIKETSKILGVSEKSVRRFLERGLLKSNPSLRIKLITRESIEVFAKMTL